jgi:hypothetical protein
MTPNAEIVKARAYPHREEIETETIETREGWLGAVRDHKVIQALFESTGFPIPKNTRVSCAFPGSRAQAKKTKVIGQCWNEKNSADNHFEIMVTPIMADPVKVVGVLIHELVHAAQASKDGKSCGHRGNFRKIALGVGLCGKMTATSESAALVAIIKSVVAEIGPYPHATLNTASRTRQSTRMIKVVCPDSNCPGLQVVGSKLQPYSFRMSRKNIEMFGGALPTCPCGAEMEEA